MERGILAAEKPRKKTEEQDEAKRKEGPRAAVIRMNLVPSGDNSTVDGEATLSTSSSTSTLSSSSLLSTVTPVFLPSFHCVAKIDLLSEEPTPAGSEILG